MTPCLLASIGGLAPVLQERLAEVQSAETMDELVESVTVLSQEMGLMLLAAVLSERAEAKTQWPACPACGRPLHSKGWVERELGTSLGWSAGDVALAAALSGVLAVGRPPWTQLWAWRRISGTARS